MNRFRARTESPRRRLLRRVTLVLSLVAIAFPILACSSDGGERARDDGGCPMGETCSPHTPQGLRFSSTPLSDTVGSIPPLAAPGRASFGFTPIGAYALPDFAVEVEAGLEALSAQRLDGDSGNAEIAARAATEGSYLRVFAADDSGLLDRISLRARPVARRGLRPYVGLLQSLGGPFDAGVWSYWHELPNLTVLAALYDDTDTRLLDESLPMSATADLPSELGDDYQRSWDTLPMALGNATVEVTVGTSVFSLQATDSIDAIVQLPQADEGSLFRDVFVCFVGESSGAPVVGVPLTYQWETDAAPTAFGGTLDAFPFVDAPCVAIPEGSGTRELTIAGEGQSATFEIPLRPADGALRGIEPSASRDGERAGG